MAIKKGYTANEGVISDGNFTFMLVPAAEVTDGKVTAALLNGASSFDATYDLKPGGFNHTPGNEEISVERLTLPQALKREGKQTDTLELTYAYNPELGAEATAIDSFLVQGAKYYGFARYGVAHDDDFTEAHLVDKFPIICGRKRKDAPTANEELTKTVSMQMFGKVEDDVKIVAA